MRNSKTAEVIEKYQTKWRVAEDAAKARRLEAYAKSPEVQKIDSELGATALNILSISASGENIEEKMARLRERTKALRSRRAELLTAAGFPEDYTDVKYDCPKCGDTGYVGVKVCDCLRREIIEAPFEDAGIGALVATQTFDTFDLSYYPESERETMRHAYETLKDFAESFDGKDEPNFLLVGASGLGKTHLSTAVAKRVIERGYRVVYDTIDHIIDDFQAERFRDTMSYDELSERYFECDLLIVDDLGCEMMNQFSLSCVYNLINTRLNAGRSTIINTNLTSEELKRSYFDRITSRLFGEYRILVFKGEDIRRRKLK